MIWFLKTTSYDTYSNSVCSDNSRNWSESCDTKYANNLNYNNNLTLPLTTEVDETIYYYEDALTIKREKKKIRELNEEQNFAKIFFF